MSDRRAPAHPSPAPARVPLDLAERLLAGGVVVDTDVTLAAAGVDLVRVRFSTRVDSAAPGT
jgi:hypothetical protein